MKNLVTRSVVTNRQEAIHALGLDGDDLALWLEADGLLASARWHARGEDSVRLVPLEDGDPRRPYGFALVETVHGRILAGAEVGHA